MRIAGLAHGTDVWLGNAQTLIQEGKATIQTAICTRDDIMVYLIQQGLEEGTAFTIMESVRKGKGLKPEWEEEMSAHGVPDWYIWSCKKIKYMFPKAHAAAYVMMAWRIAYCKVFYPLAITPPSSASAPARFPMRSCVWDGKSWKAIWQIIRGGPTPFPKRSRIP